MTIEINAEMIQSIYEEIYSDDEGYIEMSVEDAKIFLETNEEAIREIVQEGIYELVAEEPTFWEEEPSDEEDEPDDE